MEDIRTTTACMHLRMQLLLYNQADETTPWTVVIPQDKKPSPFSFPTEIFVVLTRHSSYVLIYTECTNTPQGQCATQNVHNAVHAPNSPCTPQSMFEQSMFEQSMHQTVHTPNGLYSSSPCNNQSMHHAVHAPTGLYSSNPCT